MWAFYRYFECRKVKAALSGNLAYLEDMDGADLRAFYTSPLGQSAAARLAQGLQPRWSQAKDQLVLGLGFAHPLLERLSPGSTMAHSFIMARHGPSRWPEGAACRTALVDEHDLPLPDSKVDVLLVLHGLELNDSPLDMLQEAWRVLAPQGRIILIVPNRRGLWSASERNPFGHGQPFSRPQLAALLREARLSPGWWREGLMMPPFRSAHMVRAAGAVEKPGARLLGHFGGVIMVEAVKQVYAFSPGKRARRLVPRLSPVLVPRPASRESTDTA
ncbi:MAG: methyltransferase domain-containing protein [Hyphomicrobiales bacterium]